MILVLYSVYTISLKIIKSYKKMIIFDACSTNDGFKKIPKHIVKNKIGTKPKPFLNNRITIANNPNK